MEHRIEQHGAFSVIGFSKHTTMQNGQAAQDLPAFWGEVLAGGKQGELLPLMEGPPFGLLGVSFYGTDAGDAQGFRYCIGCASPAPAPAGAESYGVPAATWAIFPCKREEMLRVQADIVTKWQPQSNYTLVNSGYENGVVTGGAPDIELYGQGDDAEIWVAVRPKEC